MLAVVATASARPILGWNLVDMAWRVSQCPMRDVGRGVGKVGEMERRSLGVK